MPKVNKNVKDNYVGGIVEKLENKDLEKLSVLSNFIVPQTDLKNSKNSPGLTLHRS